MDKKYAECLEKIDLIDNELEENRRNPSPAYTPEKIGQLYAKRQAHVKTYTDERQRLLQIKQDHQDKILCNVSYEPDSQLSNLPLSIYQLLKFGEKIGSTDTTLITMILQYIYVSKPPFMH